MSFLAHDGPPLPPRCRGAMNVAESSPTGSATHHESSRSATPQAHQAATTAAAAPTEHSSASNDAPPSRSDSSQGAPSVGVPVTSSRRRFTAPHIAAAIMTHQPLAGNNKSHTPLSAAAQSKVASLPVKLIARDVDSCPISFVADDNVKLKFGSLRLSKTRAWVDGSATASGGACTLYIPLHRLTLIRLESTLEHPHVASLFFAPPLASDPTDSGNSSVSDCTDSDSDDDVIVVIGGEEVEMGQTLPAQVPTLDKVDGKLRLAFEEHGSLLDSCLRLESMALALPMRADLRSRPSSLFVFA